MCTSLSVRSSVPIGPSNFIFTNNSLAVVAFTFNFCVRSIPLYNLLLGSLQLCRTERAGCSPGVLLNNNLVVHAHPGDLQGQELGKLVPIHADLWRPNTYDRSPWNKIWMSITTSGIPASTLVHSFGGSLPSVELSIRLATSLKGLVLFASLAGCCYFCFQGKLGVQALVHFALLVMLYDLNLRFIVLEGGRLRVCSSFFITLLRICIVF